MAHHGADAHHDVLIIGGGNAGISLAARLLRDHWPDVAVVEPERVHRYRPLLNYVGVGLARMEELERPAESVLPDGCTGIRDRVVSVDPAGPSVTTEDGRHVTCDMLVVCPGLEEDWAATPGLAEAYADGRAGSTFLVGSVSGLWGRLRDLRDGRVVFTVPPEPAPCGPTALKPLLMACDHWRSAGVLDDLDVELVLPEASPVGLPEADHHVEQALAAYGVAVRRESRVTWVEGRRVGITGPTGEEVLEEVVHAHVVPSYRAPSWVAASDLAGNTDAGLVDVDPRTMRHRRHPSIWSLGDVADLRTRPSGGALRKQVDVLARNLRAVARGRSLRHYDGYTVVPVTLDRHRLLLAEHDRDGRPRPSVPFPNLVRPRRVTWWVDRRGLPVTYFRRILRGKV